MAMARRRPAQPPASVDGVPVMPKHLATRLVADGDYRTQWRDRNEWLRAHGVDPGDWTRVYQVLKASWTAHGVESAMDRAERRLVIDE
jgi:hypothetical protein